MKNMYKTLGIILLLSSLLLAACSGKRAEGESKESSSDSTSTDSSKKDSAKLAKAKEEEDLDLVPVEIFEAWRGKISSYIILSSTIETEQYVDVYPYLTGIVAVLLAEEGDNLKKGEPLLRLDAEEYQLREARALTEYKTLQGEFKRIQAQFDKDLMSREEYGKAKLVLEQTKLSWQEAKLNLDRTTVRTPIDGVVSLRNVRQGDRVMPSTHIYSVVNLEDIIATVHVPEKELSSIKIGQLTYLTSDYLGDEKFEGYVKRISPIVNPATGTFKVTIGLEGEYKDLRPGMFINTYIVTMTNDDALLLDKDAIVYDSDQRFVFVVKDSLAFKVPIEVGFEDASYIEVLEGVSDSDKIIIVGQNGLRDKTKVKVVKERKIS